MYQIVTARQTTGVLALHHVKWSLRELKTQLWFSPPQAIKDPAALRMLNFGTEQTGAC